jgi:hypothetical protein
VRIRGWNFGFGYILGVAGKAIGVVKRLSKGKGKKGEGSRRHRHREIRVRFGFSDDACICVTLNESLNILNIGDRVMSWTRDGGY